MVAYQVPRHNKRRDEDGQTHAAVRKVSWAAVKDERIWRELVGIGNRTTHNLGPGTALGN